MTDHLTNPFLSLPYESAMQDLGDHYYDQVAAADFPRHILRFRNDALLPLVEIQPELTLDEHFIEAFGKFQSLTPFLSQIGENIQFLFGYFGLLAFYFIPFRFINRLSCQEVCKFLVKSLKLFFG
jgi:hypothetical protein